MSTSYSDITERRPLLPKATARKNVPPECHEVPRSTRHCILAALWVGTFLCNLNLTMVATLLPSITSEFKESNQASWIGTAYLLSSCTFMPLYGRLCNIVGRRAACQFALLATTLGTLSCGLSRGMTELAIARFVAGMGGGALQLLSMIVSADLYGIHERGIPQAISNLCLSAGLGLGGLVAGILNDLFGWRVAFFSQVPLFVLVMIFVTNTLRYVTPGQGRNTMEVLSRIDFGGICTLFLTIGSTITWLSAKFNEGLPWTDRRVVIPLASSIVFLGLLLVTEFYMAPEPILPPSLLNEKVSVLVNLSSYFLSAANFSIMYFIPLWFETVCSNSASVAGLHMIPHSIGTISGSLVSGWWMHRTGRYTGFNAVFGFLPLCGLIPIILMREDSGLAPKWFAVFPVGFGSATAFVTMIIALQAHLSVSSMAVGTAVAQLFRALGQVSSVAVASAIFQSRLDVELRGRIRVPDAEKIISQIRRSLTLVGSLPPGLQRATRNAYAASLRTVFLVATCAMLISYFIRLLLPEAPTKEETGSAEQADRESEERSSARSDPGSEA